MWPTCPTGPAPLQFSGLSGTTATGRRRASKDCIEKYTFDEVETLTTHPENLRQLTILEDSGETVGVHEHYTLRAAIAVRTVETERTVTPDAPPAAEERLCVTLAQQTYLEQQLAVLRDTVDTLVLASLK